MANVDFYYLNGTKKHFGPGIRVSGPFKGKWYVWPEGPYIKGSKPIFTVFVNQLHTKKKTGKKGVNIY